MKEQVQETGVRKWFGDDFINMQSELMAATLAIIEDYGACVLSGANLTVNGANYTISPGLAYLKDSTGANGRVCRIYGGTFAAANFPIYLVQASRDRVQVPAYGRQYKDTQTKNIIVEYYAEIVLTQPAHSNYITIAASGATTRFRDALQDSNNRFVTDDDVNNWNAKYNASNVSTTPTADKVLPLNASAKFPLSVLANGTKYTRSVSSSETVNLAADVTNLDLTLTANATGYSTSYLLHASTNVFYAKLVINASSGGYARIDVKTSAGVTICYLDGSAAATKYFLFQRLGDQWVTPSMQAADILTLLKTVDGAGSGLDADLLDGMNAVETNTANSIPKRGTSGNCAFGTLTVTDIIIA